MGKIRYTVFLYPEDFKLIQKLVETRKYDSISQFIRIAVKEKLEREIPNKIF